MKKFNEMTQSEIDSLSREEFESISPFEKKSCADCYYLKGIISWWCNNEDAIKIRRTRIPGGVKCPYWKPDWKNINNKYKTVENGYIKPSNKIKFIFFKLIVKWYK